MGHSDIHISTKFTDDVISCLGVAMYESNMWRMFPSSDFWEYWNTLVAMELHCVYIHNRDILHGCFRLCPWLSFRCLELWINLLLHVCLSLFGKYVVNKMLKFYGMWYSLLYYVGVYIYIYTVTFDTCIYYHPNISICLIYIFVFRIALMLTCGFCSSLFVLIMKS